jgi:hypothetical protein
MTHIREAQLREAAIVAVGTLGRIADQLEEMNVHLYNIRQVLKDGNAESSDAIVTLHSTLEKGMHFSSANIAEAIDRMGV